MAHNPLARPFSAALHAAQKTVRVAFSATRSRVIRTQIFIGLNDVDEKEQRFDTDRYISILKHVCTQYGTQFTYDVMHGGYIHKDGEFTEENTIVLTFIDVPRKTIDEIAQDLCVFFRQESVLIVSSHTQSRTVHRIADE